MEQNVLHPIAPVYDENSKILILGSFPSQWSREQMFFYGHPRNRFWKVLALLFECAVPETVAQKRQLLLSHNIALWDVIASCDIVGSADSSIKNAVPNDLREILVTADIKRIFLNGKTAEKFYNRHMAQKIDKEAVWLPSTSPANAAWSLDQLVQAWKVIC